MTKQTIVAILLGFGVTTSLASAQTTAPAAPDRPPVNQRIENQRDRIQAGVQNDQLTKGEATRLAAGDAAIHAEERVDRKANDGHLTNSEHRQINRQLNRNSRRIYRDRHNNRKPKG